MSQDIYIVGSALSDADRERLIAHLGLLESEIAKQSSVHIVDSVNDIPQGASASTVIVPSKQLSEEEIYRRAMESSVELKAPEVEMSIPMGYYNDGKTNRRERRRQEREACKHRK